MNRPALTAMLAMAICSGGGCARARSTLAPKTQEPGPVEIAPMEPIKASINQGKIPADLETVRASYDIEEPPSGYPCPSPKRVEAILSEETHSPPDEPPALPTQRPATPADARPETAVPASKPDKPTSPGADAIPLRSSPGLEPGKRASLTAAIVGNTIITYRELEVAVCQRLKVRPHELREMAREQPEQANMMARETLESMIDRTIILQEYRKEMKKPQMWQNFSDYVEKVWQDKEVTAMCRKMGVEDEFALRKKLEEQGESLDDLKNAYKEETMAREILMGRLQGKVEKPGLPEMQKYYHKHRNDPSYHRDASVKWHEILIPVPSPAGLAAARKSAATVRTRLVAGEDFAKVAKATSAGATASKGGAWETSPEGYPVPAVNKALATLKFGEISPAIESPKGIHIVRVESRRSAGPATFVEMQKPIAEAIFQERFAVQVEAYLKKLRSKTTIVSPLFEGTSTAPTMAKERAKLDVETKPASAQK